MCQPDKHVTKDISVSGEPNRIDADSVRARHALVSVAARYGVRLRKNGKEWLGGCPFHAEDTASFTVFVGKDGLQRMHCFGCGAHGDVIDFVSEWVGVGFREAAEILEGGDAGTKKDAGKPVRAEVAEVYAGIEPRPYPAGDNPIEPNKSVKVFNPKRRSFVTYAPQLVHDYGISAWVIRINLGDSRKITPSIAWVRRPDGTECWSHFPMPEPRPIYRLPALLSNHTVQVLIVEGEKCADVATALLPGLCPVSWCGGTGAVAKTDWTPLAGRKVVIWPDNDDVGAAAAVEVADRAWQAGAISVRVIRRPGACVAKGWDIADAVDEEWDAGQVVAWARARAVDFGPEDVARWRARGTVPKQGRILQKSNVTGPKVPVPKLVPVSPEAKFSPAANNVIHINPAQARPAPDGESLDNWRSNLILNDDGIVKPRLSQNFKWMLRCHPDTDALYQWNQIAEAVFLHRAPPWGGPHPATWTPRRIVNNDIFETTTWLERRGMTPRKNETADTIYDVASFRSYNPVKDYLRALVWDGCPRLAGGMWEGSTMEPLSTEYLGTPDDPIYGAFMVKWHIAAVARIFQPGCQVDNMIVLESPQGRRKSSYVRAMSTVAGVEYFCDDVGDISNKDSIIRLHGCWLVEIGELAKVRVADIEVTKSWVTRRSDRYRPPYEREVKDVPRHFVLAASVNPSGYGYLRDPTGNRRFWPIPIHDIDVDRIARDRDQIWAEAVHYYRRKLKWWATVDEELRVDELTGDRRAEDPWAEKLAKFTADPDHGHRLLNGGMTLDEIIAGIGIPTSQQTEWTARRVAENLKELGLVPGRNGRKRVWRAAETVPAVQEDEFR